ncbi:hypothetical protein GE09DRAFT_1053840 [Coniochaeta sp. 2T2.1]|nr:hypothetical protein GE09DRAFT_1053840 [Coniochaeta sp. 2T2.1]
MRVAWKHVEAGDGIPPKSVAPLHAPNWVPILEKHVYAPRKLRMMCIGAGYAGLMLAYHLRDTGMEEFIDLKIYEKNHDVGGTWLENRYPGVACDVPAHIYTFSFEPNPDWTSFYAKGPEIWEYIKRTTIKYDLDRDVQFDTPVKSAIWDDRAKKWKLKAECDGKIIQDEADILVNGSGILNKWRWPDIEGLHSFKGELLHSARWDESCNWDGKKVGIIGNGSSAIQIVPKMQERAKKLVNYTRSPTWISSNYASQYTKDGKNFTYTEEQKRELREKPKELLKIRRSIEHGFNQFFYALLNDSPQQVAVHKTLSKMMLDRLNGRQSLIEKLVPEWKVGCRRLTPGDGFLEALQEPNTRCDFDPIIRVTEEGIETAKGVEEFDIIIAATGFDVSFKPSFELIGANGKRLDREWADNPEVYFGTCAPGMPNYFIFNGPNCPVGHGSLLAVMEWTAQYMLNAVVVKDRAVRDYNEYSQEDLKRTVWTSGCRSWYKNGKTDGKVTAMYAGSILHYKEILENIRGEDFDIDYNSRNSFRFMGNGLTGREERNEDLAFYVYK